MKFCAKCGTQISNGIKTCPQCGYFFDENQFKTTINEYANANEKAKNKSVKFYIIIPIVIIISIFTSIIVCVVVANPINSNYVTQSSKEACPEDEYGNHDWSSAKCTAPAQCYNCNVYKDNKLGHHHFYTDKNGICDCSYCGMLYDDYIDSKE